LRQVVRYLKEYLHEHRASGPKAAKPQRWRRPLPD
jgi:hypothetical protein